VGSFFFEIHDETSMLSAGQLKSEESSPAITFKVASLLMHCERVCQQLGGRVISVGQWKQGKAIHPFEG